MHGLRDIRVIDFSTEIAGPYCTKLFADAGADVIKVESADGDPLRRWSATGADLRGRDGALFQFLNASKRSVIGSPEDAATAELIAGADLVVESFAPGRIEEAKLPERFPALTLLSISPFGRGGPWTHRPWTEFTLQAESGSIGVRGRAEREPFQAGGRITEWLGGAFAAVGALAAVRRARRTGHGEHVDLSLLEAISLGGSTFLDLFHSLFGRPPLTLAGAHLGDAVDRADRRRMGRLQHQHRAAVPGFPAPHRAARPARRRGAGPGVRAQPALRRVERDRARLHDASHDGGARGARRGAAHPRGPGARRRLGAAPRAPGGARHLRAAIRPGRSSIRARRTRSTAAGRRRRDQRRASASTPAASSRAAATCRRRAVRRRHRSPACASST